MLHSYGVAFDFITAKNRERSNPTTDDPLDAPEWQGIGRIIEVIAAFSTQRQIRQAAKRRGQSKQGILQPPQANSATCVRP